MLIMARDRNYSELLGSLRGRNVYIWTCNTCARLCYGLGGEAAATRLAERLGQDGVNVIGIGSTSAGCIIQKVQRKASAEGADVVVSLTCNIGAGCISDVSKIETINPVRTFGIGFMDGEGTPILVSDDGISRPLSDIIDPDDASIA